MSCLNERGWQSLEGIQLSVESVETRVGSERILRRVFDCPLCLELGELAVAGGSKLAVLSLLMRLELALGHCLGRSITQHSALSERDLNN